jgi:hypothetical protein
MKHKQFLPLFFAYLLIILLFFRFDFFVKKSSRNDHLNIFVGVDAAYDDIEEIKKFVDQIKSYTNFFVIGSTGITFNRTKLDEVCQYIFNCGLYFLVYTHPIEIEIFSQAEWISDARQRWGDRFLGLYAYDEPGGHQIDQSMVQIYNSSYVLVDEAHNYTNAANKYVTLLNEYLQKNFTEYMAVDEFPLFTSDYALYWFDYRAGYDTILTEFGWNQSRQLNIALCRGAATVQNKDWGVMITWTYNDPPYIESGEELYEDLVLAYKKGAKYIVIFDSNKDYTRGILREEHLNALKQFWQYAQDNPRENTLTTDRVAYVLPKDYGYGFRGPNDKIWGLWEADDLSYEICVNLNTLMEQYGNKLDIIYDDKTKPYNITIYNKCLLWNETALHACKYPFRIE